LGAGLDSVSFWIATAEELPEIAKSAKLFEVDYEPVVMKKSAIISRHSELSKIFPPNADSTGVGYQSERYKLIAADLRELAELGEKLKRAGLNDSVPTLFLAECVLIYMSSKHSDAVLRWIAQDAVPCAFTGVVVYEQTNPDDAFGRVMVDNLKLRGCPLLGISAYPTLDSHRGRYLKVAGFSSVSIANMNKVCDEKIPAEEYKRISKLEIFDEFEEWRLMQSHYFIAVGSKFSQTQFHEFQQFIEMWD
jgi:tRNA wybutosine-synthesizing protein 4